MYFYAAYGLDIASELPLPELVSRPRPRGSAAGEVIVRLAPVRRLPGDLNDAGAGFWESGDEACYFLEKVGAFLVRDGREINIDPARGVEERLLRLSLLGPGLGLLLQQRGRLVLHASVVAREAESVAFLGSNGWGKSTIAAALYAKGYELVTDDVAAIDIEPQAPLVIPSFPQIKLWPEALALLGEAPEQFPVLHPVLDKRGWRAERGFSIEPRRLARIYVIAEGPTATIEPVDPRQACFELLRHWYGNRFWTGLQGGPAAVRLRQSAALAGRVPMYRLFRSGGSSALLDLADLVHQGLHRNLGMLGRG